MTSQDRGNLLHDAHRRAKALGLTGEAYERELERADKPSLSARVKLNLAARAAASAKNGGGK